MNLLFAIAMLCQATPSNDSWMTSSKELVRNSQAACQQRVLKCVKDSVKENDSDRKTLYLATCIEKGVVFDKGE